MLRLNDEANGNHINIAFDKKCVCVPVSSIYDNAQLPPVWVPLVVGGA